MSNGPFYAPGRYRGVVTGQGFSATKEGVQQFVLQVDVTSDQHGNPLEQQYARTLYRVINDNTIEYFLEDMKTLGFDGESFRLLDPGTAGHQSFVGQDVPLFCKHDTYLGKTSEKWSLGRVSAAKPLAPADSGSLRQLDNLFGKQLKTLKQTTAASKPAPRQATATATAESPASDFNGISDDDIPF